MSVSSTSRPRSPVSDTGTGAAANPTTAAVAAATVNAAVKYIFELSDDKTFFTVTEAPVSDQSAETTETISPQNPTKHKIHGLLFWTKRSVAGRVVLSFTFLPLIEVIARSIVLGLAKALFAMTGSKGIGIFAAMTQFSLQPMFYIHPAPEKKPAAPTDGSGLPNAGANPTPTDGSGLPNAGANPTPTDGSGPSNGGND